MKVFLIAGEPSGDKLGAALMAGLKELAPDVSFDGVGGAGMIGEGLESRFPMEELSVMGLAEVLPRYFDLKRRIAEMAEAVLEVKPAVLITIDSPDFCLRVAKRVKAASDIRIAHYVAPTVWAWRPKRAEKMAALVDQVLALLPFEPPYMEAAGVACDFVGHPVVAEPVATEADAARFRSVAGIGDAPCLLVLPGSRRGEVARLAPVFREVLEVVVAARPDLRVVVPTVAGVRDDVVRLTADWQGDPVVLGPEGIEGFAPGDAKRAAFRAADAALAASGTVSLELAAAGTPMVIAYDMAWLSRQIIGRMLRVETVTLVNLVSETRAVPEFIGAECVPKKIAPALLEVLAEPGAQAEAMRLTMERLGRGGEAPGLRAARAVLDRL
ncbi:lipid-A-disaccharide synthase [Aestuariibius sp. 2305UL40-4]|uniref:lipid-A-disaccharide synthase n=1 Tax=Aestuariibius violaceus TaxID=3234132 RepID=UPI00345E1F98